MFGTHQTKPCRAAGVPLERRYQQTLLSKRRWWESNPLRAALQAAATPCDFSVETNGHGVPISAAWEQLVLDAVSPNKLRELASNQHLDVQSVASYR